MSDLTYLASPYSDPDPAVMEDRFRRACVVAGALMLEGIHVYSPIAHSHPIAQMVAMPTGFEFWREYDEAMIARCSQVLVLTLPGWAWSRGVLAEIECARRLGIPVRYIVDVSAERLADLAAERAGVAQ